MVEIADITDEDSFHAWLEQEEVSREGCVWLASRAAMRVLAPAWSWLDTKLDLTPLSVLRSNLIAGVAGTCPTPAIRPAAAATAATAATAARSAATAAARSAATAAARSAAAAARSAATAAAAAAAYAALQADCLTVESGGVLRDAPSLWPVGWGPFDADWRRLRAALTPPAPETAQGGSAGPDWSFWLDWYQGHLTGAPDRRPDWDLYQKVALAALNADGTFLEVDPNSEPDTEVFNRFWDRPEAEVLADINRIVEQHELLREVQALRAERDRLLSSTAGSEHRGHNQPPELIDQAEEVERQITVIWASLDEVEAELEKAAPDRERLAWLGKVILSSLSYCGSVTNVVIKAGAATLGAGGGSLLLDYLSGGALSQFAQRLIQFATGG